MKNRDAGLILLGATSLIVVLAVSYDLALENIIATSCSHGYTCPMYQTLGAQRTFSTILIILLVTASAYLIFSDQIRKAFLLKKVKLALSSQEKKIYEYLLANNLQARQTIIKNEFDLTKVKTTRILNRLEKKGLIEKKRKGLENIIVLKMKLVSK